MATTDQGLPEVHIAHTRVLQIEKECWIDDRDNRVVNSATFTSPPALANSTILQIVSHIAHGHLPEYGP
jgi:hypothetical protein